MAAPRRTQKQIAERYKGNLGYYNKKHSWRRARHWVSFLAIVGGITGIVLFQMHGHEKFFNAGKISSNHAAFGDNCASCHDKSLMTGGALTVQKFREVVKDRPAAEGERQGCGTEQGHGALSYAFRHISGRHPNG